MYCRFGNPEFFCGGADGRVMLDDILAEDNGSVLGIRFWCKLHYSHSNANLVGKFPVGSSRYGSVFRLFAENEFMLANRLNLWLCYLYAWSLGKMNGGSLRVQI